MAIFRPHPLPTYRPYFPSSSPSWWWIRLFQRSQQLPKITQDNSFIDRYQLTTIKLSVQRQLQLTTCLLLTVEASKLTQSPNHSAFSHDYTFASLLLGIAYR